MSDDADRASEREEQDREAALKRREPELLPVGSCYWCDSELNADRTFCDSDCRDDYQRARAAQERAGR